MKHLQLIPALVLALAGPAQAAEGYWTFDAVPFDAVEAQTGAVIDQTWLDRVRLAAVRLSSGCSASIVSDQGLVATNHHCVEGCEADLSTPEIDYIASGFTAARREDERTCPGVKADILVSIEDITDQIRAATDGLADADYATARDQALTSIEEAACGDDEGYNCDALSFFAGGQFKLHRYRQYDDVRLVFAPEFAIGFFGGDPDNFNFPRYALDAAFLRLYEDGAPVATPGHLGWSARGPVAGETAFVAGNPGNSDRVATVAQLTDTRDYALRTDLLQGSELRGRLIEYGRQGEAEKRAADLELFGVENTFKRNVGRDLALRDTDFLAGKQGAEQALMAAVRADPALAARIGDPWAEIEAAQVAFRARYIVRRQLDNQVGGRTDLYWHAQNIVRGARERAKPSSERLAEFTDARIGETEDFVLTDAPIDRGVAQLEMEFWLLKTREYLTADHPAVRRILGGESPESLAARLVQGTRLDDAAYRGALWEGGLEAVNAADDPLIVFVREIDELSVAEQTAWRDQVTGPIERAQSRIAQAKFALYGDSLYPDANFTLRLSFGRVEGWTYDGVTVAPTTDFAGLFRRATGEAPFDLPRRWLDARSELDQDVMLNFVSSNDILGGNSGSPVINAAGEVVGLAFDGNIHSNGGYYGYDPALNRTVSVSSVAVLEALRSIYGMSALADELTGG
jgi:hypothetical protein